MADKPVPRNDFKKQPVFVKATIADQAGHKPGYVRQWFHAKDPQNRNYWERYAKPQYVGDREVGYCRAEAWTVVQRDEAKPGRQRDDDTRGIDTALTHGDLICLETPEENAAIFREYERLRDQAQARKLQRGDSEAIRDESGRAVATYKARVGDGTVSHEQLLNEGT